MSATLKDIAKRTNLSLGTVSNYINGRKIKEKNRILIKQAIDDLNYSVNQTARSLRTNKSSAIGIIFPTFDDPYAAKIATYLTKFFREHNYAVIASNAVSDENERTIIDFMISKQVEGIIAFPVSLDGRYYEKFDAYGIPVIFIDKPLFGYKCDVFMLNNREVSRDAIRLAIQNGHKNIGIIAGSEKEYTADERLKGYIDALEEAEIPVHPEYIQRADYSLWESALKRAKILLTMENPPTAIFATNYFFTLSVIVVCNDLKIQIGKDIHLIGFDNLLLNGLYRPTLCMVEQPMEEFAQKASELLLKIISGATKAPRKEHICFGTVREGESLGKIE